MFGVVECSVFGVVECSAVWCVVECSVFGVLYVQCGRSVICRYSKYTYVGEVKLNVFGVWWVQCVWCVLGTVCLVCGVCSVFVMWWVQCVHQMCIYTVGTVLKCCFLHKPSFHHVIRNVCYQCTYCTALNATGYEVVCATH